MWREGTVWREGAVWHEGTVWHEGAEWHGGTEWQEGTLWYEGGSVAWVRCVVRGCCVAWGAVWQGVRCVAGVAA